MPHPQSFLLFWGGEGGEGRSPMNSAMSYIIKIKIHSSCEIEDFVETDLCKRCLILRSRVLRVVIPTIYWVWATRSL